MVGETVHFISDGVVGNVHKDIDILASCGDIEDSRALARRVPGYRDGKPVILLVIALVSGVVSVLVVVSQTEITDPFVDFFPERLCGRKYDQGKRRYGITCLFELIM
jgi:hypothetical protein